MVAPLSNMSLPLSSSILKQMSCCHKSQRTLFCGLTSQVSAGCSTSWAFSSSDPMKCSSVSGFGGSAVASAMKLVELRVKLSKLGSVTQGTSRTAVAPGFASPFRVWGSTSCGRTANPMKCWTAARGPRVWSIITCLSSISSSGR